MKPAEQDAAIRAGKGSDLLALRFHRLRIATFEAEGDQRSDRQVVGLSAVPWRNLLLSRGGVVLLALATRPAAAMCPFNVRVGLPAARVRSSRWFSGD